MILLASSVTACSDFILKAKDGSVVNGRSMEFPIDLRSEIFVVPAGASHSYPDGKGGPGLSWTTKYGFLGINAFGLKDCYVDGFNEKGLSMGGLMFTGAQYQEPKAGKSFPLEGLSSWILGNFSSVDEVRAALPGITVYRSGIKELKDMGLHISIHDATGKSLVVEFIGGKMNVYDNPIGILTNRPEFPWQMTNLRNYVNLDAHDKDTKKLNGVDIEPMGVGSGLLGLPGDWTPPSRFVRLAVCKDAALEVKDAKEAVVLAEHMLNIVDIPKGAIKETPNPFIHMYGYAQWVVIKDLTNKTLYFKTYDNTAWRTVDLKKFDLSAGKPVKSIPISSTQPAYIDVTGWMR